MHGRTLLKQAFAVVLSITTISIWLYAYTFYRNHQADIIVAIESIARELALPYHIARLQAMDPIEQLPVPVHGVALKAIDDTWGAARAEGRTHEGTDIFAEHGTPVFSTTEGYVLRLNVGSLGGNNVMIIGPGGLRYYYAHLSRIADGIDRGAPVTPDTILGFVGNTGNATTTPPHLHFGIYRTWRDALNPYPLLINR